MAHAGCGAEHEAVRRAQRLVAQASPLISRLVILTPDDKLAEIKRLYYQSTRQTIAEDFARAVQLLKSMASEEERERAAVYMDGLSQMRSDWNVRGPKGTGKKKT